MFPAASELPACWYGVGWGLWCLGLLVALHGLAWRRLPAQPETAVVPAAIVILSVLWQWQVGVQNGLVMHYLGAMPVTLMLGWRLAVPVLGLAVGASVLLGATELPSAGLVALLLILLPIGLSHLIWRLQERFLPRHVFVFLLGTAFFGAWIVVVLCGLAVTGFAEMAPAYREVDLWGDYFPYFLLLGFSEAWISGMFVTLLVVYRPDWVAAFDDKRYLSPR